MRTDQGDLGPLWSHGSVLPTSLVDLLQTVDQEDEMDDESDEAEENDDSGSFNESYDH